jgi:primosomal protein N''
MVNREKNFNRKYEKRLQTIKNKKRSRLTKVKPVVEEKKPEGYSKKMAKRQNRYETICKSIKINVGDLFKKGKNKKNKLKNKLNNKKNKKEEKMDLE